MAKLNTNSNAYIISYATVLVLVVAFLLAFVSSSLKERQDKNVENDVKSQILATLGITADDVDAKFAETVKDHLWTGTELQEVPASEFKTSYESEIKAEKFHVFVATIDGDTKYVVPVSGMGLWGQIWGYVALNSDKQTVFGVYFDHQSETAGLGAEIKDSKAWQTKFVGKKIIDGENIILGVKKSSEKPNPLNEVDGVTGATLTMNGVDDMLKDGLKNYLSFIQYSTNDSAKTDCAEADDSACPEQEEGKID